MLEDFLLFVIHLSVEVKRILILPNLPLLPGNLLRLHAYHRLNHFSVLRLRIHLNDSVLVELSCNTHGYRVYVCCFCGADVEPLLLEEVGGV